MNFIQHNVIFFCRFIARASDWRSLSQENWPTTGHCRDETYRWSRAHSTDVCLFYFAFITYALYSGCTLERGMNIRTKFYEYTLILYLLKLVYVEHALNILVNIIDLKTQWICTCVIQSCIWNFAQPEILGTRNINTKSHTNTYWPCNIS